MTQKENDGLKKLTLSKKTLQNLAPRAEKFWDDEPRPISEGCSGSSGRPICCA